MLYEEYYFNEFSHVLGNCQFEMYDLSKAIEWLVIKEPRIFRIPRQGGRTGLNTRETYSCKDDVRDDPAFQAAIQVDDANIVHENLSGYWIPEQSNGRINRELYMYIKRSPSLVRFLADCLASEVNYAIGRIREA